MRIKTKPLLLIVICLAMSFATAGNTSAETQWPQVAYSKDGTPISYEVSGPEGATGEPTLVFVHGWSCDARYWRSQVPVFSKKYRVVVFDLAGHGHSGMTRKQYTMTAFGEDVRAVVDAVDSRNVILIGHSMGGTVIAEAARLIPKRVIGLIGVDTLENIEYPLTEEELKKMTAPLEQNFQEGSRQFVREMIRPETDPQLRDWILADMSAAPPEIALSAMKELMTQYVTGDAAKIFETIKMPVVVVNGDLWPVNADANRRHMASFEAIVLKDADHFLMMDQPAAFNKSLEKAIRMLTKRDV